MRRLVDVDELIKYFAEDLEGYDNREYILQMLDTKGRIERVEAIPIEWIEEYTKSLVIKRRFLAENGYRDNRCYDYMFGIIGMLDDWDTEIREKKNEID